MVGCQELKTKDTAPIRAEGRMVNVLFGGSLPRLTAFFGRFISLRQRG